MDTAQQTRPISAWYITELPDERLVQTLTGRGWEIREIKSHYKYGGLTRTMLQAADPSEDIVPDVVLVGGALEDETPSRETILGHLSTLGVRNFVPVSSDPKINNELERALQNGQSEGRFGDVRIHRIVKDNDPIGVIEKSGVGSLLPQIQSVEQVLRPPPEPTLPHQAIR